MSLLKRIFGEPSPDPRDTNQLISDLAQHRQRPKDMRELYRRLPRMEVYASVREANFPLQNAGYHVVAPGEVLKISKCTLPNGHILAPFFVDRTDPRLARPFMGMSVRNACEMVLKMHDITGLMLYNPGDYWIALLKPELERLLKNELAQPDAAPDASDQGVEP
jgi:hypothetical protein